VSDDPVHVVSISGGKDSLAARLVAIERDTTHIAVFADTGHEHPLTYEYLDYLEEKTGPIQRVRADFSRQIEGKRQYIAEKWPQNGVPTDRVHRALELLQPTGVPFLDLCMWKGRFPSTKARFCSSELKHEPIHFKVVEPLLEQGDEVVSWQGVRADESKNRAELPAIEEVGGGLWIYRPILEWTADDAFAIAKKHGVEPNPLYKLGMGRVGCMPCIHCRKDELRNIANRFPEEIKRVAEWEELVAQVSKLGVSSLFAADKTPEGRRLTNDKVSYEEIAARGGAIQEFRIDAIVNWARTGRGGVYLDLFNREAPECSSLYGLCE